MANVGCVFCVVLFNSAMSVRDQKEPVNGKIRIRGNVRQLGDQVQRGFVSVCSPEGFDPELPGDQSGRRQLAEWIADANHPLTARVYVNRVWRHLFGRGLVESTDNFGAMGQTPSHPQLLDFLANRFVDDGWSTKKLIRLIMCSRVYQLSTDHHPRGQLIDDQNRLLWRANRRRLDAEAIRDSILAISGQMDPAMGGLTIRKISQYDLGYEFNTVRRSVYVPAFRNAMLDFFEVFDVANPNLVTGNRNTSTLPTQSLYMLNSQPVIQRARDAAERLLADTRLDSGERVRQAYRMTLGRFPTDVEMQLSQDYLGSFDQNSVDGWASLFQSLFASLDFRYMN